MSHEPPARPRDACDELPQPSGDTITHAPQNAPDEASLRHLLDRAVIVEERVRRAVYARQRTDPDPDDAFRGLYLSDEAVHRLLGSGRTEVAADEADAVLLTEAEARADASAGTGRPTQLHGLIAGFGLTELDVEILLIALVPDLDERFEQFYGYLNDNVSRHRPSIGLALRLCGLSPADAAARARIGAHAPLRSGGLVMVEDLERPFLARSLRVPDRVTAHLLGDDTPDPRIVDLLAAWKGAPGVGDPGPLARSLAAGITLAYLQEDQGGAGTSLAAGALSLSGHAVLGLDLERLAADPNPVEGVRVLVREARLAGAGLVCGPVDVLARDKPELIRLIADTARGPVHDTARRENLDARPPVILVGRIPWDAGWSVQPPLSLPVPRVDPSSRAALWMRSYDGPPPGRDVDIGRLLSPFLLAPEQLSRAARAAAQMATSEAGPLRPDHVRVGARAQNAAGLDRLARRVEPTVGWSDLVLPPNGLAQLRELTARARHRDRVLGDWGMRPGGGRGRGVSALFAGDSGTGKTMSAEVIAADLGLDLYKVDLATVIDKYVGETEKNLERIFSEAAGINGVLLFDEADAIFGKRSEVKDAHDRYANVESAYLLQRMETFDGLAILATNLRANLDDAFTRRLDLVVDFPLPDADQRRVLWDRCLGSRLPRSPDLDLDFCAEAFELAGGNIRSVAVTAAYLAAESGTAVTMADLIHAVQREYQKLGRLTLETEFGRYTSLLAE